MLYDKNQIDDDCRMLCRQLRKMRTDKHESQEDVVYDAKMSERHYRRIEKETGNPGIKSIIALGQHHQKRLVFVDMESEETKLKDGQGTKGIEKGFIPPNGGAESAEKNHITIKRTRYGR